jgi:hypothetical protein
MNQTYNKDSHLFTAQAFRINGSYASKKSLIRYKSYNKEQQLYINTRCASKSGNFETLFFLVRQHWGGCRYGHFAANFKVS